MVTRYASELPAWNRDEVINTMSRVTVGATAVLSGLAATVTSIMLIPEDSTATITMNIGNDASATTARVPVTGIVIPCTQALGHSIEVYSAGEQFLTLLGLVPRN